MQPSSDTPEQTGQNLPTDQANQAAGLPVIIITGLSGAGKTTVLNVLEDIHFFTVDGLPSEILPRIVEVFNRNTVAQYRGLALGVDLRADRFALSLDEAIKTLHAAGNSPALLFLEADEDVLLRRYASTRRPHPLEAENMSLEQAVREERKRLTVVREHADLVVDSSTFSIHDLRRLIQKKWSTLQGRMAALRVNLISFGFKYGIPADVDMLFDLRFLPNPYFESTLRPLSGLDKAVAEYVLGDQGRDFLDKLAEFLIHLLPQFEAEGRYRLTIGLGCTGGRHRSVAIAEALRVILKQSDYPVSIEHRHLELG